MKKIRTNIIKMGNSRGIRIPKPFLDKAGVDGEIEIEVLRDQIILRPVKGGRVRQAREGWEERFRELAKHGDDEVLTDWDFPNKFDKEEWYGSHLSPFRSGKSSP